LLRVPPLAGHGENPRVSEPVEGSRWSVEGFGPQNLFSPQDDPNREIDDIVGDAKSIDKEGSRRTASTQNFRHGAQHRCYPETLMPTRRKTLAALWAAAVVRAHEHAAPPAESAAYRFAVLNAREAASLRRLTAILIPADERSGGAPAAKVDEYVDHVLRFATAPVRKAWRDGLRRFAKKDEAALRVVAANEFQPRTPDERFFVMLKDAAVEGFYTSREGIEKELGYRGYTYLREFPLANMAEVKRPPDYRPMLRQRS